MTWKTTAAASGVMVVATWLASHAPVGGPREPVAVSTAERTEMAAAEMQRAADRLHGRLQLVASFKVPARNPFRFSERPVKPVVERAPVMSVEPIAAPIEPPPPTFRMKLSGIGEDGTGDQMTRTAIISTLDNVLIVKVGDAVGDGYKVAKIEADAVELERLDGGPPVRLALTR